MTTPSLEAERAAPELLPRYAEAVAVVNEQKRASVSLVQRRLRLSWGAACNLIEAMLERGDVPLDWAPPVYQLAGRRAAPAAERVELPPKQSIDTLEFRDLIDRMVRSGWRKDLVDKFLAYIDGRTAGAADKKLRNAVLSWWEGYRPTGWSAEQHIANQTVNIGWGVDLALLAASLAAAPSQMDKGREEG